MLLGTVLHGARDSCIHCGFEDSMQRFKKYIGKDFLLENVRDSEALRLSGFTCDSLPNAIGDFDELEFLSDLNGQTVLMCVAIMTGKVKRIMFVLSNRDEPDDVRPLTEAELKAFLDQRGDQIVNFFEDITQ
jgi:hypothetical protein